VDTAPVEQDMDRVVTVPNLVTTIRLLLLPVFIVLVVHRADRLEAACLLGVLGATDWVDGYLARRINQVSTLGKVLDPVADRLLLLGGITAIVAVGAAPLAVALAALLREAIIAVATILLAAAGAPRIDVQWTGKAGTFCLMFAFPFFLAGHSSFSLHSEAEVVAWLFTFPGLVFAWYALLTYFPKGRQALAARRGAARDPDPQPEGAGR
jgi:cardiolipin synthase